MTIKPIYKNCPHAAGALGLSCQYCTSPYRSDSKPVAYASKPTATPNPTTTLTPERQTELKERYNS